MAIHVDLIYDMFTEIGGLACCRHADFSLPPGELLPQDEAFFFLQKRAFLMKKETVFFWRNCVWQRMCSSLSSGSKNICFLWHKKIFFQKKRALLKKKQRHLYTGVQLSAAVRNTMVMKKQQETKLRRIRLRMRHGTKSRHYHKGRQSQGRI